MNGVLHDEEKEKFDIACDYFRNIFESKGSVDGGDIYRGVISSVTLDMNSALLTDFRDNEILIVKEMGSLKASSYDGFPAIFLLKLVAYSWGRYYQFLTLGFE